MLEFIGGIIIGILLSIISILCTKRGIGIESAIKKVEGFREKAYIIGTSDEEELKLNEFISLEEKTL